MAILNSIRKRGVFLIVIIALALFSFILADVIRNGGFSTDKSQTNVATVNGEDISREDFMQQVEATQRTLGPTGTSAQAMNIVWERELRSTLIDQQIEKLGLTAEKEQISAALKNNLSGNPQFQNEAGMYDYAKVLEYVADVKQNNPQAYQQWLDFEQSTERNLLQNMYFNMIKGGLRSTEAEGEQQYRFENDKVNIEYVHVPYSKIADEEVSVTDDEIKKYIKAHPSKFEVEPQVDIQYVSFTEEPSEGDIEAAKTEILELLTDRADGVVGFRNTTNNEEFVNSNSDTPYNDRLLFKSQLPITIADTVSNMNVGQIYGPYKANNTFNLTKLVAVKQMPDTVSARHILIPVGLNPTDNVTRTDEQAKATADSLLTVLKGNRAKFAELVTAYSSDVASIEKEGLYEDFAYGSMVPEFRDFSFERAKGDMGVVKTDFGYHLIEVMEQKNSQKAYKIATVTKEIEPSEGTLNDVFGKATKFEVSSQDGDFAKVAEEQGLNVKPVNKIGQLDANIPGIGNNRTIINWAYEEDTNVGDVKRFGIPEGGYVIAQLTRKSPKGLMSIAEASSIVTPILRNEKKAKKIRESITGNSIQEVASSQSVTVQNASAITMSAPTIAGAGSEPTVVGAAFGKKAGEETGLIDGNTGVFKVRVLAVNKAPDLATYANYAEQLNTKVAPTVNNAVYNALKKAAEIEDNRANFF